MGDYHVVAMRGNQVEIQPSIGGPTEMKHVKHVKYILPRFTLESGRYLSHYKYWTD